MRTFYGKTCTLPVDLIPLLKSRGLVISNETLSIDYLTTIGYFRFSAF